MKQWFVNVLHNTLSGNYGHEGVDVGRPDRQLRGLSALQFQPKKKLAPNLFSMNKKFKKRVRRGTHSDKRQPRRTDGTNTLRIVVITRNYQCR